MKLRTHFKDQYPEYNVAGNFYQGYMDMSFFSLAPKIFKEKDLKIAVVFIHGHTRFEVWLTGKNSTIQTEYRKFFRETSSNEYTVSLDKKGVTTIIESILVKQPDFDNPEELTKQIDTGLVRFIEDMEKILK